MTFPNRTWPYRTEDENDPEARMERHHRVRVKELIDEIQRLENVLTAAQEELLSNPTTDAFQRAALSILRGREANKILREALRVPYKTHETRFSDSSIYDEVCIHCGATDATWDTRLDAPCPNYKPETERN